MRGAKRVRQRTIAASAWAWLGSRWWPWRCRSAGSLTWAGIFNTHYWIDPARQVVGVIMTQTLPFGDPRSMQVYGRFERAVYDALKAA
jgi:CubicO group peptidase (beta-lactamase class C family)